MNTIRSIIVDDEQANRELLRKLLEAHCPYVSVCGAASSVDEAVKMIEAHHPEILFLDIKMPGENGFDLLRMYSKPDFTVIFVTSYDEFAIQAFEFNAVDYILKPIDYTKLIRSVERAAEQIELKAPKLQFPGLIRSLDETAQLAKSLPFHLKDKVTLLDIGEISFIRGISNYCEVVSASGRKLVSPRALGYYEAQLQSYDQFLRISKGVLININYVVSYTKGRSCFIEMKNSDSELEVSRRKKQHILQFLKSRE